MKDTNPIEQDWSNANLEDARDYLTDIINDLPYGDETRHRLMLVRDVLTSVGAGIASLVNVDAEFISRSHLKTLSPERQMERTADLVEKQVGRKWVDDPERPGKGMMIDTERHWWLD